MPQGKKISALPLLGTSVEGGDRIVVLDASEATPTDKVKTREYAAFVADLADSVTPGLQASVVAPAQEAATRAEAAETRLVDAAENVYAAVTPGFLVVADGAYAGAKPPFFSVVSAAIYHARARVAATGGRILLRLLHDPSGQPLALPAPHTPESLRAEGIDVETAGQSGDGNAARFAAHVVGWWLGQHALSEAVLAETGYSVNLDALPFPIYEGEPPEHVGAAVAWEDVTGKPDAYPPLAHVHDVFWDDVQQKPALPTAADLTAEAQARQAADAALSDRTNALEARSPWQRISYDNFARANTNGQTRTQSGYDCGVILATASGATGGGALDTGAPRHAVRLRAVAPATVNNAYGGSFVGMSASGADGVRVYVRQIPTGWRLAALLLGAAAFTSGAEPTFPAIGAPSDSQTFDLSIEFDGVGTVTVVATPLGGSPVTATFGVTGLAGNRRTSVTAANGGYVTERSIYIYTP